MHYKQVGCSVLNYVDNSRNGQHVIAKKISKSAEFRAWHNIPEGSTLVFGDIQIPL